MRSHQTGAKHFHHPVVGDLTLTFAMMELAADSGLNLLACSAEPGSRSEEALSLLGGWAVTVEPEHTGRANAGSLTPAAHRQTPRATGFAAFPNGRSRTRTADVLLVRDSGRAQDPPGDGAEPGAGWTGGLAAVPRSRSSAGRCATGVSWPLGSSGGLAVASRRGRCGDGGRLGAVRGLRARGDLGRGAA